MDNSDENKKILIIGIVVIIVILAIWFWPKGNKNPGNDTNEVPIIIYILGHLKNTFMLILKLLNRMSSILIIINLIFMKMK